MSERKPTLPGLFGDVLERFSRSLYVMVPGVIEKFYKDECAVDVLPQLRRPSRTAEGDIQEEEPQVLPRVPLQFPGLGEMAITFPVRRGMFVMVVFADRGIAQWALSGKMSGAPDFSFHGTGGAVAIPGLQPFQKGWKTDDQYTLIGKHDGPHDFVALATDVKARLDAIQQKFDSHSHTVTTVGSSTTQTGTTAPPGSPIGSLAEVGSGTVKVST